MTSFTEYEEMRVDLLVNSVQIINKFMPMTVFSITSEESAKRLTNATVDTGECIELNINCQKMHSKRNPRLISNQGSTVKN